MNFHTKYLLFIVLLLLVVLVIVGCFSSKDKSVASETNFTNEKRQPVVAFQTKNMDSKLTTKKDNNKAKKHFGIGDTHQLNELTVKLVNVREMIAKHIKANKGKFIGVELEIKNNGKENITISSLPLLSLLANDEKQDVALIETKGKLDRVVKPGETIVGEVAFDSRDVENYILTFKNPLNKEVSVNWMFTKNDIKK